MSTDRLVLMFAGIMILLGVTLTLTVSSLFLIVPGFVGANLLQSSFTGFCPLAKLLRRAGCSDGSCFR